MKTNPLLHFLRDRLVRPGRAVSLAARTVDDHIFFGNHVSAVYRDRMDYDRDKVFAETLRAWRVNPIARSIVRTITAFVVGRDISISCEHAATQAFLRAWWEHPLNDLAVQLKRWKDEDTCTGNLFFLFSVDPLSGMSYVRVVPAELIAEIQTAGNDIQQETYFVRKELGASPWPAYDPDAEQSEFMLHFASNQPVGVPWGEPDLAPLLPWIGRLSSMLEDRARLHRFRNAFLFVVNGRFGNAAEKRRAAGRSPPTPRSPARCWSPMKTRPGASSLPS